MSNKKDRKGTINIEKLRESCKSLWTNLQSKTPKYIQYLRDEFDQLDTDRDGFISKRELRVYSEKKQINASTTMTLFDEDNNGLLDFDEMAMLFMFIKYKDTIQVGCNICNKLLFRELDPTFCACADCFDEGSGYVHHNCCGSDAGMHVVCIDCVSQGKKGGGGNHADGKKLFRLVQNHFDEYRRVSGIVSCRKKMEEILTSAASFAIAGTYGVMANSAVQEGAREGLLMSRIANDDDSGGVEEGVEENDMVMVGETATGSEAIGVENIGETEGRLDSIITADVGDHLSDDSSCSIM